MITVNEIDYVEIDIYTIDIYYMGDDDDYAVDHDFAYLSKMVACTQFDNNILTDKCDWLLFYFIYHDKIRWFQL